jgi:hypothetical protein
MKKTKFIAGALFFGTAFLILATLATMWLWNWLMPAIFNLTTITFWQAAGILVLSKIIFSGGCHSHQWHSDRRKKYWHSRLEEKWKKVPDEKKEQFIQKMKDKGFHNDSETKEQQDEKGSF